MLLGYEDVIEKLNLFTCKNIRKFDGKRKNVLPKGTSKLSVSSSSIINLLQTINPETFGNSPLNHRVVLLIILNIFSFVKHKNQELAITMFSLSSPRDVISFLWYPIPQKNHYTMVVVIIKFAMVYPMTALSIEIADSSRWCDQTDVNLLFSCLWKMLHTWLQLLQTINEGWGTVLPFKLKWNNVFLVLLVHKSVSKVRKLTKIIYNTINELK